MNIEEEPGLPDFSETVVEMRQYFRKFIGDPTVDVEFTNFQNKKLNKDLLNWKEETSKRREVYFDEIIENGNFSHCKHKNKKMPTLEVEETFKTCLNNLNTEIDDEDDPVVRANLSKKLANILSKGKTEKDRFEMIKKFRQEILDGNIE